MHARNIFFKSLHLLDTLAPIPLHESLDPGPPPVAEGPTEKPVTASVGDMLPFRLPLPRLLRRCLQVFLGLLGLYASVGFLLLPWLIKRELPTRLGQQLKRPVRLAKVRMNPFTFSLTLEDLQIGSQEGKPLFAVRRFYGNWELVSLFQGGLHFKAIEVRDPQVHLAVRKDGRLNIADLLGDGSANPAPKPAKPLDLRIDTLWVEGARLAFEDHSRPTPFATVVGPVDLLLQDFRTLRDHRNPCAMTGRTESGERFSWTGHFVTDPLGAEGRIRLENLKLAKYTPYFQDQVGFELRQGSLNLAFAYQFHWQTGREALRLQDIDAQVDNLLLAEKGQSGEAITLPRVAVDKASLDVLERRAELPLVRLDSGRVEIERNRAGKLNLERLFRTAPSPDDPQAKPLRVRLGRLALEGFAIRFQDLVPPRPVKAELRDLGFTLEDFSLDPAQLARVHLSAKLGEAVLTAQGQGHLLKPDLALELQARGLDLRPFDAYLEPDLALRLNNGRLDFQGQVDLSLPAGAAPRVRCRGDLSLLRLEVMDAERREPFLRYGALRMQGLDVSTAPERVAMAALHLEAPEHRIVMAQDGTTNVGRALKLAPPTSTLGAALPETRPSKGGGILPLAISLMEIRKGLFSFVDRSLEPEAALLITNLEGQYKGLSTQTDGRSEVNLRGLAGGLAPLSITGHAMPFRHDQDTDITLKLHGADLVDFNPYAMKHLGYTVRKGKLDTEAHIRIQKRQLQAETHLKLDQFYLGEKVKSPDATRLPVKLGLAILRDRKGVIDVDLPIQGSLDDPDVRYGRMVWKVIASLFTKLVTSPFSALGKLVGGGEQDLSFIAFESGRVNPGTEELKKLDHLVRALQERPDLSLEVEGVADPDTDTHGLKKLALEQHLQEARARTLGLSEPGPYPAEERPRWLQAAYDQAFPTPPLPKDHAKNTPRLPPPPPAEMEQRLLSTLSLDPGAFQRLADARGKALMKALLEAQVAPERLFETEGGERAKKERGSRVYFGLR